MIPAAEPVGWWCRRRRGVAVGADDGAGGVDQPDGVADAAVVDVEDLDAGVGGEHLRGAGGVVVEVDGAGAALRPASLSLTADGIARR